MIIEDLGCVRRAYSEIKNLCTECDKPDEYCDNECMIGKARASIVELEKYLLYNNECCYEDSDFKPCELQAMDCISCEYLERK